MPADDDPDYDPFEDGAVDEAQAATVPQHPEVKESGPVMSEGDNWVSFSFVSDGGYEKVAGTVHGAPAFVAEAFGIEEFDGRVSTLMKKALKIDRYFKKWAAEENPGKD